MKKLFFFSFLLSTAICGNSATVYETLLKVNRQLIFQPDIPGDWKVENYNDGLLSPIQLHLSKVETTLRNRSISSLSQSQRENRFALLDQLHSYWQNGAFPINTFLQFKTPVFIDSYDNFCAVGYLIKVSGNEALARGIQKTQNFAYLKDIRIDGLAEWAQWSGFSTDELAWIQPGYQPSTIVSPLLNGVNGSVYDIMEDHPGWGLYACGNFTQADGLPANNIAVYTPGFAGYFWMSLGEGTNGKVYALERDQNTVIAGGAFTQAGGVAAPGVAKYNGSAWETMGEGIDGDVYDLVWYQGDLYAAGAFSLSGDSEGNGNVARWNGTAWESPGWFTNGPVYKLFQDGEELFIGGDFSEAGGIASRNIARVSGTEVTAIGAGTGVPVRAICKWHGNLIAGGKVRDAGVDYGVMKWDNNSWVTLPGAVELAFSDSNGVVYDLKTWGTENELLVSGNVFYYPLMGVYGRGVVSINTDGYLSAVASLDSTVRVMYQGNSGITHIGGDFHFNQGNAVNGIATIEVTVGIDENDKGEERLETYPVPANGPVNIVWKGKAADASLFSVDGRLMSTFILNGMQTIEPTAPGIYFLVIETGSEKITRRIIRQ